MTERPRFSVVVPTRNRPETLRHALTTCLDQDFEDYEIIVCDNSDPAPAAEVAAIVAAANSPRIRYLPSDRPLAMSANWERGLSEALGEYVTVLGDDDGLMPYALRELDRLVSRTGAKAIRWQRAIYTWPTIGVDGEANLLIVEPPGLSIDETQQMHLTGASGVTYQIQFLDQAGAEQAWQPLFEVSLPDDSSSPDTLQANFRDESAPATQRFYRAMVLPVPAGPQ